MYEKIKKIIQWSLKKENRLAVFTIVLCVLVFGFAIAIRAIG